MNVKQAVVQRQLIAKELTVRDALEEICTDMEQGELIDAAWQKRMTNNLKVVPCL